jgi:Flp pilus assembly protein TadG
MRSSRNHCHLSPKPAGFVKRTFRRPSHKLATVRRGAAAVLGLVLTISLVTLMAFTIDFGYINVAETQMRRCADAAAMAACWEMFDQQVATNSSVISHSGTLTAANESAKMNTVGNDTVEVASTDLELGTFGVDNSWDTSNPLNYNAVRVTLRRHTSANGELPLFFGELTGRQSQALQMTATAAMFSAISGFYEPDSYEDMIDILPIALDTVSWGALIAGQTEDDFTCVNGVVSKGPDGVCDTNLYPKGNGSPGNWGTVDIGGANNTTADLARQILYGISKQDMIDLGTPLTFDVNGECELNGDTGISAGVKDELASIKGQHRIIPICSQVSGTGNNAMYTIVAWEGVTILDVRLTGNKNSKRLTIQPAKVVARHARIDYTGTYTSNRVVTPVMLVE